jgi:hypothetical protein
LFKDIPAGVDVYNRLQQIYRATSTGSVRPQGVDAYFIVRDPEPAEIYFLKQNATELLTSWRQMASQINQQELVKLLTPIPEIKITSSSPPEPDPTGTESLGVLIYDIHTDWRTQLEPMCPHASWMREAFYYINCDYYLADYVIWPWFMKSSPIIEPMRPYFNLWLHGAELHCHAPDDVTLFVPSNEDAA